jgi:aspartate/methionine/tyrosine aminotransferase
MPSQVQAAPLAPAALNADILAMEYAVRGPIPDRAAELAREGRRTILCNIGNPQALGQRPITWYRQVLSLAEDPSRIGRERTISAALRAPGGIGGAPDGTATALAALEPLPNEALDAAERFLSGIATGMGAYTASQGPLFIRQAIAGFIDTRDEIASTGGRPADPEGIFLTNGASEGAKHVLEMLLAEPTDGILVPIPQYPLYSATIRKAGGRLIGYHPDEERGWALARPALEEALAGARAEGVSVKAIVVINPGNPTGGVLDGDTVSEVIAFAAEHGLAIIADEVYQENTYGAPFVSFASRLGDAPVALFSLHSTSKGFIGECGHRGGYLELRNPPPVAGHAGNFTDVLRKLASVSLCPNTAGQLLTWLMVSPPPEGSPSHTRFTAERDHILDQLLSKATMIREAFDEMEGVSCFGRTGAMYLFPRLDQLPAGTTDFDYCMALLEQTGLCTVNGAGFGQRPGTHHLRIAFLPPKELLEEVLPEWLRFHDVYLRGGRVQ